MLYSNTIPAKNNQIIPVFYDGRPMHSKYDPLREAENFVQNIKKSDFFVVAGIGAGYHIKKISEKFPESVILAVENSNLELDFLRKNISEIKTIEKQKNIYFSTLTDFPEKLKNLYVPAVYDKINLVEYARNDVYVIFRLDSNKITNLTGQYHITNQDGEYISSGKYTVS